MDLSIKISDLTRYIRIQRDCIHNNDPSHDYMHGMLNGMLFSQSILTNTTPKYHVSKRKRRNYVKVRHKMSKNKQPKLKS